MSNQPSSRLGLLAGLGSGTSFAAAALLAKVVYGQGVTPWAYTAAGSLAALPLLLPWCRGPGWRSVVPAGLAGALSMLLYNVALARLRLSVAAVFAYTFPAFALLLAWWWRGQVPNTRQVLAGVLCLAGVALVSGNPADWGAAVDVVGALCALGAAVAHAAYGLLGERLSGAAGARAVVLTSAFTVGLALLWAPGAALGGLVAPLSLWGWFALSAVIARIVPLWLFSTGSRLAGAGPVALTATVELPLSLLIGLAALGEQLAPTQWAGALLVVGAIWLGGLAGAARPHLGGAAAEAGEEHPRKDQDATQDLQPPRALAQERGGEGR